MNILKTISQFFTRALPYTLIGLVFILPISYRLTIDIFFVCTLFWLLSGDWYNNLKSIITLKPIVMLIVLWFLYAISLLYSENIERGISDIIQKISFLIFPLIFVTKWNAIKSHKEKIINSYLLVLSLMGVFVIIRALLQSLIITPDGILFHPNLKATPWENYFFYTPFTQPNHPTYFSMFYSLGLVFIASKLKIVNLRYKIVYIGLAFFFLVLIYLSSSKAGIVTGIYVSLITLFWVLKNKDKMITKIAILVLFGIFLTLICYNQRIVGFMNYFNNKSKSELSKNEVEFETKLKNEGTVRFNIWSSVPKIVGKRWLFGVGIGDSKQELVKGYQKYGVENAEELQLNAHNQYLETFIGLGLVGLSVLLILLGIGFKQAIQNRNMVLFLFLSIITINFLFESVLERIFGVIFFTFFYTLLAIDNMID